METISLFVNRDFCILRLYISLQYIGGGDPVVTPPTYSPWETIAENNPITFIYTKWEQGAPFNSYTPTVDGKHCPAGCVAVAFGQLLTWNLYHRNRSNNPEQIGDYAIDWNTIFASFEDNKAGNNKYYDKDDPTSVDLPQWDAIARLLRGLGQKFDMNYTLNGSGGSERQVMLYMMDLLFRRPDKRTYSQKDLMEVLKMGYPVYMSGYRTAATTNQLEGHAWVVDGFCKQERTVTEKEGTFPNYIYNTSTEERLLFHCNFGWAADCDGYYIADVFDLTNGPVFKHEIDDRDGYADRYYNMYLEIIHYYGIY